MIGQSFPGFLSASYATSNVDGGSDSDTMDEVAKLLYDSSSPLITVDVHGSYGFGTVSNADVTDDGDLIGPVDNSPDANTNIVTSPEDITMANSSTSTVVNINVIPPTFDQRWSATIWDFGSTSQIPALKFADYDGPENNNSNIIGTDVNCSDFPEKIPGTDTDTDLVCTASSDTGSLIPGQR